MQELTDRHHVDPIDFCRKVNKPRHGNIEEALKESDLTAKEKDYVRDLVKKTFDKFRTDRILKGALRSRHHNDFGYCMSDQDSDIWILKRLFL